MELSTFIPTIIENGMTPALLLVFIYYFLNRDKTRDKQLDDMKADSKERMDSVLAEGIRREEILRSEAEKREDIMRQEAERRELMFTRSIDILNDTLGKIANSTDELRNAFFKVDLRLEKIEDKISEKTGG